MNAQADGPPNPSNEEAPEEPAPEEPAPEAPEEPAPEEPAPEEPAAGAPAPEAPVPAQEASEEPAPEGPAPDEPEAPSSEAGEGELPAEDAPPGVEPSPLMAVEDAPTDESFDDVVVVVGGGPQPEAAEGTNDSDLPPEEVIIAGTRSAQMAGAIQVVGQKQLERAEYDDPHAVLRQVPGVFVREEDGTGLRPNIAMRGVNPDRSKKITLMEDGILFGPAPYSAPAAYYFPLMTRMTQVRVIKGPGAVAFGPQTVAGAIDVITRRVPVEPTVSADLSYGQYGYRKVHAFAGTSNEQFGVLFEGVHLGNDGFKELGNGGNTGSARNEWMAKAFYLVDPTAARTNEFSVKLTYSEEASNETYLGLTDEDFHQNPDWRYPASSLDRMDNHRTSVALTHQFHAYEEHVDIRTTAYRNDFSRTWRKFNGLGGPSAGAILAAPEDPENAAYYGVLTGQSDTSGPLDTVNVGPNQRDFVSQGIYSRLRWAPPGRVLQNKIEVGLRAHHDSIARDHSEDAFQMVGGELYPMDQATTELARNKAATHALSVHLTDAVTWRALTVTPGVRIEALVSTFDDQTQDKQSSRSPLAVMPGVGTYYALTNYWGVLAGAHRGFSPPAPGSDPSVKPETSINYEAGTRVSANKTRAEVIGFFNDYSNLTDVCTFSSGCLNADLDRQFDAGEANIYGVEIFGAHEQAFGPVTFPLSVAYTFSRGEFRNDFASADPIYGNVLAGDEIPYLPRHQLNAMVGVEVGPFEAYSILNYVAATRELAGSAPLSEVQAIDRLVTVDAGASVKAGRSLKFYVNGRNLGDYRAIVAHRPFGARPNAPRWVQVGVKAEF